jgi:hypothetical protein
LDLKEVAVREESHPAGIHAGNAGGTGFTFCEVAYLLKLEKFVWLSKEDS